MRAAAGVVGLLARLDPDSVPSSDAPRLWQAIDGLERAAAGAKLRLARRVEDSAEWKRQGYPSPAHYLARKGGTTVGRAKDQLSTSRRLPDQPQVDAAVRDGQLSEAQASAVSDAAGVAPDRQGDLLDRARRDSLGELRDHCARTKAAARGNDGRDRHDAIHANRFVSITPTADGGAQLLARGTVDAIARMRAVICAFGDVAFRRARGDGRHEPHGAYLFDGLADALDTAATPTTTPAPGPAEPLNLFQPDHTAAPPRGPARPPVPTKIIVRLDWDAYLRGWPVHGETCEIAGLGPVPVSLVEEIMASGDAFLAAVVTRGTDVHTVAHLGRKATAHQHTALEWLHPTCVAEGCDRTDLETDHTEDWARTRITALWHLTRPCTHHHQLKTRHGWKLVDGTGKRPMVPPDHPLHPDNARPPPHTRAS